MADTPVTQSAPLVAGQTTYSNTTVLVNTAVEVILPNDPTTLSVLLVNISGASIFVGNTPQVGLNNGIELVPSGGYLKIARWEDYDYAGAKFYAIATADDSPLQIVKITAVNTLL